MNNPVTKQLNIGGTVRRLRRDQHRTQQEIAGVCGFTKSLLSKIENNKVVPPVATLVKIAAALGVQVSVLIESNSDVDCVFTSRDEVEKNIALTGHGEWIYPFATERRSKKIQPCFLMVRKGELKLRRLAHEGEEFIYVVEGEMKLQVDDAEYRLGAGSSLYFNAASPHRAIPVSDVVRYIDIFV